MDADGQLRHAVTSLCKDVDGIDWDGNAVQTDIDQMLAAVKAASTAAREAAFDILLGRLRAARLEDADGVAHVAISAGTLVEYGAPPGPLAEVLLAKLPDVLDAARRYADACVAELGDEEDEDNALLFVDHRAVPVDAFRKHLGADRPGACALHRLREWVLPTVASLSRDREMLRRACADTELRRKARTLRDSEAHWLDVLLGVELDARWLALFPIEGRGFELVLDGVVSNFELHTLVAAALIERGIAGTAPPRELVAYLEGHARKPNLSYVEGVWQYYDWRAAKYDLAAKDVPHEHWVWNEGAPEDVPMFDGTRVLLIGPSPIKRTWSVNRSFGVLPQRVSVTAELPADRVQALLAAMRA